LYFHGACGAAGVGCCGDGRGADVPGGDGTVGVHRGIEVVRGAPRDGPVDRDSYLVAHIEPDGLPVEFRRILLFAPCRSGSDAAVSSSSKGKGFGEWIGMESVFNPSFFCFSVISLSLFNCIGFSNVGFSCVGFSNVGFSNVGETDAGTGCGSSKIT